MDISMVEKNGCKGQRLLKVGKIKYGRNYSIYM
jgi:hypothetical protein